MRVRTTKDGRITISDFSQVQALKIAVRMEGEGIDFYRKLLTQVKDEEARREIDFLIRQEEEHRATFRRLLEQERREADDAFEEDDIVDYMNTHVFDASLEKNTAARMDHRHLALEEALNMERRSIIFYEACLKDTTEASAGAAFQKILQEEESHLKKFGEMLRLKCIDGHGRCIL